MIAYEVLYYCNNTGKSTGERVFGEEVEAIPEPVELYHKIKKQNRKKDVIKH